MGGLYPGGAYKRNRNKNISEGRDKTFIVRHSKTLELNRCVGNEQWKQVDILYPRLPNTFLALCMKRFETSFLIKSLKSININFFNDFDVKLINVAAI